MTHEELTSVFTGATISMSNTWNGSREYFTVAKVGEMTPQSLLVYGEKGKHYYIPLDIIDTLVETGKASRSHEIDHCDVREDYTMEIAVPEEQEETASEPVSGNIDLYANLSTKTLEALLMAFVDADMELCTKFGLPTLACQTGDEYQKFWEIKMRIFAQLSKNDKLNH